MLPIPDAYLKLYSPGRGLGLEPLAKLPTRGKLFREVAKLFKSRVDAGDPYDVVEGAPEDQAAIAELRSRLLGSGRAVIKTPLVERNESLLVHMFHGERPWEKIVTFWALAEGPAFATRALCRSWGVQYEGLRYESGVKVSNARVTTCTEREFDYRYLAAFKELRRCMGLVSDEAYAEGVAAAASCREGAPLDLRMALSFAFPTETSWSEADAREVLALREVPESASMLVQTLADPSLALKIFSAGKFPYSVFRSSPLVVAWRSQEAAIPALIAAQRTQHEKNGSSDIRWGALEALALMPTPEVFDYAFEVIERQKKYQTERIAKLFFHAPAEAVRRLSKAVDEGGTRAELFAPHLQAVKERFPSLDDAATPRATEADLPEALRGTPDETLVAFAGLDDVMLASGDKALAPDAVQQLAILMRGAAGGRTPACDEAIAALDTDTVRVFAHTLFDRWAERPLAEHKWIGRCQWLVGDDSTARHLGREVKTWSGKYYNPGIACLDALVDLGSDVALVQISLIANKGKSKGIRKEANLRLQRLAERQGLTSGELADRLVPTLGLDPSGTMMLDYGARSFRVGVDAQLKPFVVDEKGKQRASMPKAGVKDDAAKAKVARSTFSAFKKDVRLLAAAQTARLESAMCDGRMWSVSGFDTYLRSHPLMVHLVRRVVWGCFADGALTATFRVDDTGATVSATGESVPLTGTIGVVHPAVPGAEVDAWRVVFDAQGVSAPFAQLDRETFHPGAAVEDVITALEACELVQEGPLRRLLDAGWTRGAIEDNGIFYTMHVARGGVKAEIRLDPGLSVGWGGTGDQRVSAAIAGPAGVDFSEVVRQLSGLA